MSNGIIPDSRVQRLAFFKARLARWAQHVTALGLRAEDVASLGAEVNAALEARSLALALQTEARGAFTLWRTAEDTATARGRAMVKTIKAAATARPDAGLYALGMIPPPADGPGAPTPPHAVSDVRVGLQTHGEYIITWSGELDGRTYYIIERSLTLRTETGATQHTPYTFIAAVQQRRYLDRDVPRAVLNMSYRVTAYKGEQSTPPAIGSLELFSNPPRTPEVNPRSLPVSPRTVPVNTESKPLNPRSVPAVIQASPATTQAGPTTRTGQPTTSAPASAPV